MIQDFVTRYGSHFMFSYSALKKELTSQSGAQCASLTVHKSVQLLKVLNFKHLKRSHHMLF